MYIEYAARNESMKCFPVTILALGILCSPSPGLSNGVLGNCAMLAVMRMTPEQLVQKFQQVEQWSFESTTNPISPLNFIHPMLAAKFAKELGPLSIELAPADAYEYLGRRLGRGVNVRVLAGTSLVFEVNFAEVPGNRRRIVVENFGVFDPTNAIESKRDTQKAFSASKGFSAEHFRYAVRGLQEVVRAGGYEEVLSSGAESYLTAQLYKRVLGASPADRESSKRYLFLEKAYKFLRQAHDPEVPIANIEDFHKLIGTLVTEVVSRAEIDAVETYSKTGKAQSEGRILADQTGEVKVLVFKKDGEQYFVLIDPFSAPPKPFSWKSVHAEGNLQLLMAIGR